MTASLRHFSLVLGLGILLAACGGTREPPPPKTVAKPLNDTGVTRCFGPDAAAAPCPVLAIPGQDGEFGRDARRPLAKTGGGFAGFDFSKLGENGQPLPIQDQSWQVDGTETAGTRWSCVQDHVTGLVWEIKDQNNNSAQHFNHTYSWYDPNSLTNAGASGRENLGACVPAGECDTDAFITYLNSIALCGRQNWRLPQVNELLSIINQDQPAPPVDTHYFPNTSLNAYWTGQSVAQVPAKAWYVYFTAGSSGNLDKSGRAHLRLVSPTE